MPPKAAAKGAAEAVPLVESPCSIDTTFPLWDAAQVEGALKAGGAAYEDPDGQFLPAFLAPLVDAWKRPGDMGDADAGPTPVIVLREASEKEAAALAAAKGGGGKDKGGKGAPDPAVPAVKQIRDMQTGASVSAGHEYNEWLMYQLLNILKCPEQIAAGDFLWENIWPKDANGQACNSPSGKYVVRCWVMNEWRMVVVDDRVPVDVFGGPLLPNCSRPNMLWAIICAKAVYKLMYNFKCIDYARPDKVPVLLWLTGWMPEALAMSAKAINTGALFDRIEWGAKKNKHKAMVSTTLHTRAPKARKPPRLMVIYGPSAVGRGPMIRKMMEEFPDKFELTVSDTSRPPKAHEIDGVDYNFKTKAQMEQAIEDKAFLECCTINGHLYGTTLRAVQKVVEGGRFPIVRIEGQGVKAMQNQVGKYKLDALYVHVVPPSIEVLGDRMRNRYREHDTTIQRRIEFTQSELEAADEASDLFETMLDHGADEEKLYYDLKVAVSVLSPIIRNRLRGLPAYVLDYADVIPSNSVEKMIPKPVVLVGPSCPSGRKMYKEMLIDMLFEEFPEVFEKLNMYTTMKEDAVDPNVEGFQGYNLMHCTVEELDAMAAEGKAFVVQQEKFVHPMVMNQTMVTREECNRVSAMPQLSLLSVDMEGARMITETGMDCMMIFIGPETVEFFKDRLFSYLLPTEEQVKLGLIKAGRDIKAMKDCTDVEIVNDDLLDSTDMLKDTISDYRPDVICTKQEVKEKVLTPLVFCGPPQVGTTTLLEKLRSTNPDKLVCATPYINREMNPKTDKPGEYVYVSAAEFQAMQDRGEFFDVTEGENKGDLIGYSAAGIEEASKEGKVTLLDLSLEVAHKLQKCRNLDDVAYVYIEPPSVQTLVDRHVAGLTAKDPKAKPPSEEEMETIRSEHEALIKAQMAEALEPAEGESLFGHQRVLNDDLEDARIVLMNVLAKYHPALVPPFVKPLVIVGPYGSGKRTHCVKLLEEFPESFGFAVNTTTREPAKDEKNGEHFHFVTPEAFREDIKANRFVEWMETEGQYHGMSHVAVRAVQGRNQMCVVDVDMDGAVFMKQAGFDALYVYVETPSERLVHDRLLEAGVDAHTVERRLKERKLQNKEFEKHRDIFDHVLDNTLEDICYIKLKEAISACSPRTVPLHAVWGFGRPLWDPPLRVYGQRPLKMCVLGAALSGKTTICTKLAAKYDVPVISTGTLLRDAAYDNPTELGLKAKDYLDSSDLVPDSFIVELAKLRIAQEDCMRKGWIFDGFPRMPSQIEIMEEQGVIPDKVVFVDVTFATLYDRATGRQLDPETGRTFNHMIDGLKVEEQFRKKKEMRPVRNRLTIRHDDTEENIANRLAYYDSVLPSMRQLYRHISTYVDGNRDLEPIVADIAEHVASEDKYCRPENELVLTPVKDLDAVDYFVLDTVKFKRTQLLRIQDLVPVVPKVHWVELSELVKVAYTIQLNYRYEDYASSTTIPHLNLQEVAPSTMLYVDSPEPTELLVSFNPAPPPPVRAEERRPPLVMCGPSGAGKSTLITRLLEEFPAKFGFSISHTTREPREGEENGVHYHFTTKEEMQRMIEAQEFVEHAEVHDNLFGTSKAAVEAVTEAGKTCILDLDVKRARIVKQSDLKATYLFVSPPSMAELERRLRSGGTETEESIRTRLANAAEEMLTVASPGFFHRVLMNSDLEATYKAFREAVMTSAERAEPHPVQLLGEQYDWQASTPGYHHVNVETPSSKSVRVMLPRGRSLLAQTVDRGYHFSVTYRSTTELTIKPMAEMLREKEGVFTHEALGQYADSLPGTFNLWMRQKFTVSEATTLTAKLSLASADATNYVRLVMLDNDTGDFTAYMLGAVPAVTMHPNTDGYTLLAYARPPTLLAASRWRLLMVADKDALGGFETLPLTETRTVTGVYAPNKEAIVTRQCISAAAAQQLTLHVETHRECTFVVTLRKPPPAAAAAPEGGAAEEEPVAEWTVTRSFTAPVVLVPALPMSTEKGALPSSYILDVRLVPALCYFTIEHNGDIPMELPWMVAVASNAEVEVTADTTRERKFASILEGWNAKDPKGRAEAAKAALDRFNEELAKGEAPVWATARSAKGRDITLEPRKHHVVQLKGHGDRVLGEEDFQKRAEEGEAALERAAAHFEEFRQARDAAHDARMQGINTDRATFKEARTLVKTQTETLLEERDEFVTVLSALRKLVQPTPEEDATADAKAAAAKGAKGAPEVEEVAPEEKQIKQHKVNLEVVKNLLSGVKQSALDELKSYMVAPPLSSKALEAALLLVGRDAKAAATWPEARGAVSTDLMGELTAYSLEEPVDKARWKPALAALGCIEGGMEAVLKESLVGAMVFLWAERVVRVCSTLEAWERRKAKQAALAAEQKAAEEAAAAAAAAGA